MRKKFYKIVAIILSLCLLLTIFFYLKNKFREYEMKEKYSFSETINTTFKFSVEEKKSITQILNSNVIETDDTIGFKNETDYTDLYYVNSLVEVSKALQDNNLKESFKSKLGVLTKADLKLFDILNLLYYVNICKYLNISYNLKEVYSRLENYYDKKAKLFYLNNTNDTINMKIVITALCCETIPSVLKDGNFDIITGVKNAYDKYNFTTDKVRTFYNSGADILYCYSILGLIDDSIILKHKDWFEFWKEEFESIQVDSFINVLAYTEYYKIAIIFDEDYSKKKIQLFYDDLIDNTNLDDIDYCMISNVIKKVEHLDNVMFNMKIINNIKTEIMTRPLLKTNMDLLTTVYGVMLAKNCDFKIDSQKLQNYINQSYNGINEKDKGLDQVNNLYYTIILDELNNNYHFTWEAKKIQKFVDTTIKMLEFKEDIVHDIIISRKILETVMDLQIHNVDIHINKSQINKIEKGLKKAIKEDEIINSVLITEVFIIDNMLNTNLLESSLFDKIYSSITINGGSKAVLSEDYPADIYSTYRFFVCYDRNNNYDYLSVQKKYIESLKVSEGAYSSGLDANSNIDLGSVLYGNSILKTILGGDK